MHSQYKMSIFLYVLCCEDDNKYFVGSFNRKVKNPITHFNNQNTDMCYLEDHPMSHVVSCKKVNSMEDVDREVIDLMKLHGALNVRGVSYMSLSKETIRSLMNMPCFSKRKCLLCNSNSHSSDDCHIYNTDDDSDYVPSDNEDDSDEDTEENDSDSDDSVIIAK